MSTEKEPEGTHEVSIPSSWRMPELRLEQDSERPEVTATYLAEQAEIARLSEMAESIPPRASR